MHLCSKQHNQHYVEYFYFWSMLLNYKYLTKQMWRILMMNTRHVSSFTSLKTHRKGEFRLLKKEPPSCTSTAALTRQSFSWKCPAFMVTGMFNYTGCVAGKGGERRGRRERRRDIPLWQTSWDSSPVQGTRRTCHRTLNHQRAPGPTGEPRRHAEN